MVGRPQKSGPGTPGGGADAAAADQPPPTSAGGSYKLDELVVGCKIFVQKPDLATGDLEERKAEILSIRQRPKAHLSLAKAAAQEEADKENGKAGGADASNKAAASDAAPLEDRLEYYVHYCEFNKRLDEWVSARRLILSRELEWPKPASSQAAGGGGHAPAQRKRGGAGGRSASGNSTPAAPATPQKQLSTGPAGGQTNLLRKAALQAQQQASTSAPTSAPTPSGTTDATAKSSTDAADDDRNLERGGSAASGGGTVGEDAAVVSFEMVGEDQDMTDDVATPDNAGLTASLHPNRRPEVFSKEQEIEKLRTSGSMTQSSHEVARVKNLNKIQMGRHEVETWYFSPYPIEYAHLDTLYICEMCLSYFPSPFVLRRHRTKCTLTHPPGNEIYRHEDISFFEIDGRRQKTWCRNLCLLSKCFLDHKTLYYDVDPFLYYIMAQRDDAGAHIIGYFSKEKESAENYNVACILTLPQHQRSGFGKLLIEFSYELTKREHKLGSPEKPLSDLGLLGYRAYWAETIVELLLRTEEDISIDDIAMRTAITHADVLHTCTALNMLKHYQGKHYLVLNDQVLQNHEKQMKKKRRRIVPDKLNWEPPKFTRDQLRFGW